VAQMLMLLGAAAEGSPSVLENHEFVNAAGDLLAATARAAVDRSDLSPFLELLERACAALATRCDQLRAKWHLDGEMILISCKLRWVAPFLFKSACMLNDSLLLLHPRSSTGYTIQFQNIPTNDELSLLIHQQFKTKPESCPWLGDVQNMPKAPFALFNWFSIAGAAHRHQQLERFSAPLWRDAGVFFAGVPWDIAPCPALGGRRVLVIDTDPEVRWFLPPLQDGQEFPWLEPHVDISQVHSRKEVEDMLDTIGAVPLSDAAAVVGSEGTRTNNRLSPMSFHSFALLLERHRAGEIPVAEGTGETEATGGEGLALDVLWRLSTLLWTPAAHFVGRRSNGCERCGEDETEGGDDLIPTSQAVANLMGHYRDMVHRAVVDGGDIPKEIVIAGTGPYGSTTSCAVCGCTRVMADSTSEAEDSESDEEEGNLVKAARTG